MEGHQMGRIRRKRIALGLSLAGLAAAAVTAFVPATVAPAAAASCPPPPSPVYPFVTWGDWNPYVLTTGGSFENGMPSWSLSGGAAVVSGNAPNALDPKTDAHSLYLPAGSTATSQCVTAPQIVGIVRFFVRSSGTGQLRVEVLVKGGVYPAGTITAGSTWAPSPILVSTAPAYKGAATYQIRLTPIGTGAAFTVDDVYFDPYASR
jgi:hypothetical protein